MGRGQETQRGRVELRVKTGGRGRTEGGRRIKKSAECSTWIHLEYYLILSCLF